MMMAPELIAAFLVGLAGAVHCLGMCGGITMALTLGGPPRTPGQLLGLMFTYNLGRVLSYSIAGALAGGLGAGLFLTGLPVNVARWLSVGFMVLLGIYLLGWRKSLAWLESWGQRLWQKLAPLTARFLPVISLPRAFFSGVLWGWLPCGMVYATLMWALASGSAQQGALLMMAFGLGTMPMLLFAGGAAKSLAKWMSLIQVRRCAGAVLLLLSGVLVIDPMGFYSTPFFCLTP